LTQSTPTGVSDLQSLFLPPSSPTRSRVKKPLDLGTLRDFHNKRRSMVDFDAFAPAAATRDAGGISAFVSDLAAQEVGDSIQQFCREYLPRSDSHEVRLDVLKQLAAARDVDGRSVLVAAAFAAREHGLALVHVSMLVQSIVGSVWVPEVESFLLADESGRDFLTELLGGGRDRVMAQLANPSTPVLPSKTIQRRAVQQALERSWKSEDDDVAALLRTLCSPMPASDRLSLLEKQNKDGERVMHLTARNGLSQVATLLLSYGVSPTEPSMLGESPLACALSRTTERPAAPILCKSLLDAGAVVDDRIRELAASWNDGRLVALVKDYEQRALERHALDDMLESPQRGYASFLSKSIADLSPMSGRSPGHIPALSNSHTDLHSSVPVSFSLPEPTSSRISSASAPWKEIFVTDTPDEGNRHPLSRSGSMKVRVSSHIESAEEEVRSKTIVDAMSKGAGLKEFAVSSAPEPPPAPPLPPDGEHGPARFSSVGASDVVDYEDMFGSEPTEPGAFVVWVIDGKFPEFVEPEDHGEFFTRDCYVVFDYDEAAPKIHVWHGSDASVDKRAISAIRAVELNRYVGDVATIHRHDAASESPEFIAMFHGDLEFEIVPGGSENSFRNYSATPILSGAGPEAFKTPRLYCVQTRLGEDLGRGPKCRIWQTEPSPDALSDADSFVLDCGNRLFTWRVEGGQHAGGVSSWPALQLAQRINQDERHAQAQVVELVQPSPEDAEVPEDLDEFWLMLGTTSSEGMEQIERHRSEFDPQLRRVAVAVDAAGVPAVSTTDIGRETIVDDSTTYGLSRKSLNSSECLIFDCFWEVFVWLGRDAPRKTKEVARKLADALVGQDDERDPWVVERYATQCDRI
jgi:Gelsolin repeat